MPSARRPLRIAFVTSTTRPYGTGRSLLDTFRAIDRVKFSPQLITVAEGTFEGLARSEGVEVNRFPWLKEVSWKRPVQWLAAVGRFARWIRRFRMDVIELNLHHSLDTGLFFLASRIGGARFVARNVGMPTWISVYDKFWLSRADRITSVSTGALSPYFQKRRSDLWSRIRQDRVEIIPVGRNIRDLDAIQNGRDVVRTLGVPDSGRVVGMVANIYPLKRQDLFLKAAKIISGRNRNVWFILVGGAEPKEQISQYVRSLRDLVKQGNLSDRVIFAGYRSDAVHLMKHFDVLVLPSSREALGGVLIEAMGLGVPTVSSDSGGIPEVVADGVTGFLVKGSDPGEYASAVLRLLADSDCAARMREAAKERARQFDTHRVTRLLEQCYERVCLNGAKD